MENLTEDDKGHYIGADEVSQIRLEEGTKPSTSGEPTKDGITNTILDQKRQPNEDDDDSSLESGKETKQIEKVVEGS